MPRKPAKSFPFNDLHPDGIVILFIAFAVDASAAEIEAARHLLWRAYAQETYVIGILIHPQDDAGGIRAPQLDVVIEALDARIALQGLVEGGIDLEQVSGVMLVLWQAPLEGVTVSQAREASQALRQILGPGSLHLTLRLRTRADWSGVAVSMTLVVSVRGGRLPSATECR